jgi:hypothetical protein
MHMYSAHDTTIMPILAMLNLEVNEWPPFAADIIFELYEDADKKHYITVRYLGKVGKNDVRFVLTSSCL